MHLAYTLMCGCCFRFLSFAFDGKIMIKLNQCLSQYRLQVNTYLPFISSTPKSEEEPRPISRSGPSCWSELGYNPEEPKSVGLVSVAAPADIGLKVSSSQFKASPRPVRRQPVKPPIKTGRMFCEV